MAVLEQIILEIGPHPENPLLSGARDDITQGNYNQAITDLAPILADPTFTFNGVPFTRAQTDEAQVLTFTAEYKQMNVNDPEGAINKILDAKAYVDVNMPQRRRTLNTLFDLEHAAIWVDQDVRDRARDVLADVDDRAAGGEKIWMTATLDYRDGSYVESLAGFERLYGLNPKRPGLKDPIAGTTFDDTDIGKTLVVLRDPAVTNELPNFDHLPQAERYNYAEGRFRHGAVRGAMEIFNEVKGQLRVPSGRNPFSRTYNPANDPDSEAKRAMEAKIMHFDALSDLIGGQPKTALQKLQQANRLVQSPFAYEKMADIYQLMK